MDTECRPKEGTNMDFHQSKTHIQGAAQTTTFVVVFKAFLSLSLSVSLALSLFLSRALYIYVYIYNYEATAKHRFVRWRVRGTYVTDNDNSKRQREDSCIDILNCCIHN